MKRGSSGRCKHFAVIFIISIFQRTENAGGISATPCWRGKTVRKVISGVNEFFSICRGMKVSNYEELLTSNAFSDILVIILCYWFVYRCADSQDRQDRANKTLVNVKAGIEHLADKLQHLKAVRTHRISVRFLQALEQKEQKKNFSILTLEGDHSCRTPENEVVLFCQSQHKNIYQKKAISAQNKNIQLSRDFSRLYHWLQVLYFPTLATRV